MPENNNNEESVIQLQWVTTRNYGEGNPKQAAFAYNGITLTGIVLAFLSLPLIYRVFIYLETKEKSPIMLTGNTYPEIQKKDGGYTFPLYANPNGVHVAVKKYIIGSLDDNGGVGGRQAAANNIYVIVFW